MELNSWTIFIIIITNLIGIACLYIYYKSFHKKTQPTKELHDEISITNDKIELPSNDKMPMTCPFMAAFKKAKKIEADQKKVSLSNVETSTKLTTVEKPVKQKEIFKKGFLNKVKTPEEVDSFYEHIPSHVKQLEQKKLMMTLGPEEREAEERVRVKQLEQIYSLMGQQSDLFGIQGMQDIQEQMKLYVQ